jgi:phosphatidyl-myo-inositol dimannoside synthase
VTRILVATDHIFLARDGRTYDAQSLDRAFFDDYRSVFDEVFVLARCRAAPNLPLGARLADGEGVEVISVGQQQGMRWWARALRRPPAVVVDAVENADALCARLPSVSGALAVKAARARGRPYIVELLGEPGDSLRMIAGRALGGLAAAVVRAQTRRAIAHASGLSYVSFSHLQRGYPPPAGVQVESVSSVRLMLPPPSLPFSGRAVPPLRIAMTAALVPVKGHRDLFDAVAACRSGGLEVSVDLLGDGPLRQTLEEAAARLGIAEAVTFHGHVASRQSLVDILAGCDMFVLSSRSEGMPRAMIEAMAVGLPVLGADIPAISELLPVDQVYATGDAEALAGLIRETANPTRLQELAARNAVILEPFDPTLLSAKRRALYETLRWAACGQ